MGAPLQLVHAAGHRSVPPQGAVRCHCERVTDLVAELVQRLPGRVVQSATGAGRTDIESEHQGRGRSGHGGPLIGGGGARRAQATGTVVGVSSDPRVAALKGGLIVSCQAYPGEPLRDPAMMTAMAQSAVLGGAIGIRAQGLDDCAMIAAAVTVPLIGLVKVGSEGVFITPTVADALAVSRTGAGIVAIDGTERPRPDGRSLAETIAIVHAETDALVMADADSLAAGLASEQAGADLVGTTLAGYTGARPHTDGPDLELLAELCDRLSIPVLAEGRIRNPYDASACLDAGAYAVVVGTAITHPTTITRGFVEALGS